MTFSLRSNVEDYAREVAQLTTTHGALRVTEAVAGDGVGAWTVEGRLAVTRWHQLAVSHRVGVRGPDDGDHWPAHAVGLEAARQAVALLEAAAADAGVVVLLDLPVTAAVLAARPHRLGHWAPTPAGRRLAGTLAFMAARGVPA